MIIQDFLSNTDIKYSSYTAEQNNLLISKKLDLRIVYLDPTRGYCHEPSVHFIDFSSAKIFVGFEELAPNYVCVTYVYV